MTRHSLLLATLVVAHGMDARSALGNEEPAHEGSEHAATEVVAAHHEAGPPAWRLGIFGMGVPSYEMSAGHGISGPTAAMGGGLFLKWAASHRVTVGLVAHVLDVPEHHALELPVDLVAEFPFHVTERFHPYLFAGFTVQPLVHLAGEETGTRLSLGVLGGGGMEYWVARRVALFVEVDLAYLRPLEGEENTLEPTGSAGMMFAFGR